MPSPRYLLLVFLTALLCGCLTEEQLARLDDLTAQLGAVRLYSERLADEVKAGKVTPERAAELAVEAADLAKSLQSEIAKVRAEGVPWYAVLVGALSKAKGLPGPVGTAGSIAAVVYAWLHRQRKAERDTVILGVEKARKAVGVDSEADKAILSALTSVAGDNGLGGAIDAAVHELTGHTH
jgi:hypothetical protein